MNLDPARFAAFIAARLCHDIVSPAATMSLSLEMLDSPGSPEEKAHSERTLREMFFPPFEQVVKRTAIDAVMASYNEIDGVPSHANKWLLQDVLRGEWGYRGAVVSDYYAIEDMARLHNIAPDNARAGEIAAARGDPRGFLKAQIRREGADLPLHNGETSAQRTFSMRGEAGCARVSTGRSSTSAWVLPEWPSTR